MFAHNAELVLPTETTVEFIPPAAVVLAKPMLIEVVAKGSIDAP
jgi:hypothetical protein